MNYQTTFCTKINSWTSVLCLIERLLFPDLVMTSDTGGNPTRLWLRHASEPDGDRKTSPGGNCEDVRKTEHNKKAHPRDTANVTANASRLQNFQPPRDFQPFPLSSSCTLPWVTALPSTRKCPSKRTHKVYFTGTFREPGWWVWWSFGKCKRWKAQEPISRFCWEVGSGSSKSAARTLWRKSTKSSHQSQQSKKCLRKEIAWLKDMLVSLWVEP